MFCKDLKVVNLNITEDHYDYRGLFRLCLEDKCIDVDLMDLSDENKLKEIKKKFSLEDEISEIKNIIMDKIMEASKIESRIVEGKQGEVYSKDSKYSREIDSLSIS
jgi:hypothetical protein